MLPGTPAADAIVQSHLAAKPDSNGVRLLYVRALLAAQRFGDATAQLDTLTRNSPQMAQAWLTLGALHLQLREPAPAIAALQKYIAVVQASPPAADTASGGEESPASKEEALTRGWLLLSQAADLQGDFNAADAWLARFRELAKTLALTLHVGSLAIKLSDERATNRSFLIDPRVHAWTPANAVPCALALLVFARPLVAVPSNHSPRLGSVCEGSCV